MKKYCLALLITLILAAFSGIASAAPLQDIRQQSAALALAGRAQGVAVHAEFEVREFLRSGKPELADKVLARLEGIADACTDAKATEKIIKAMGGWFFERYPFYFACWELEKKGLLSPDLKKKLAPLRELPQSAAGQITGYERGINNRAFNFAGDALVEAINHPENPLADDYKKYADACWRDWIESGTTAEVMPSYNRLFLAAILDLAEMLGKEDELRGKMAGEFKRYFQQMSGNGVRGGEAESMTSLIGAKQGAVGVPGWYALDDIYGNPWESNCTLHYADIAIKAARVFKDPEYIWYARTILANGDIPDEQPSPEARAAIAERLGEFERDGMKMKVPQDKSFVSTLPFRNGPIPDRVILMPKRVGTGPFAAFYTYDRMEGFMHGAAGQAGNLYEFSMDGSLLLRHGSKYSHAPYWENTIFMTEPWRNFPSPRPGEISSGKWATASVSLLGGRSRWVGDDEYSYNPAEKMPFAKQTNPMPTHRLWGNYNVFSHAGDSLLPRMPLRFLLKPSKGSVAFDEGHAYVGVTNPGTDTTMTLTIENIRLVGPKGEKAIDMSQLGDDVICEFAPPSLERTRAKTFAHQQLTGDARRAVIQVATGSRPGCPAWRIQLKPGATSLILPVREKFDLTKDYTRLALDYKYDGDTSGWLRLPMGFGGGSTFYDGTGFGMSQGAILQSARTDQKGADSLGILEFGNVWTAGAKWTRRALLTGEGLVLVCDDIAADKAADGWTGGVLWHVGPDWKNNKTDEKPATGDTWFDAPPFNRAYWQHNPKRLLVWFAPGESRATGMEQRDQTWNSAYAVWQKAALKGGETKRFITVLAPHEASALPAEIAGKIKVSEEAGGKIALTYGAVRASLAANNTWEVVR